MQIIIDRDPSYAPCCYLICQVDERGHWNTRDEATTVLVQSDWDWPSLASNFGWEPCHDETDGTIDCSVCGRTASDMIAEAGRLLNAHLGEPFDDPGYFEVE